MVFSVLGAGLPVTVFAHGLGGSSADVRPLAARTAGTRVLLDFRGHGGSAPLPEGWDYEQYAADLLGVADEVGATRAVGLSLGAGALLRLLSARPDRFERLAFLLPATLDRSREDAATARLHLLGVAMAEGDRAAITALLLDELPEPVRSRTAVRLLVARRADLLAAATPCYPRGVSVPLLDRTALRHVTAPSLVVGQQDDPLHPLAVAEELAATLPSARLLTLPPAGLFWTALRSAQSALADHLSPRLERA